MDIRSPFLQRVQRVLRARRKSLDTERAYLRWIKRFILYHQKRHPTDMGTSDIEDFLTHLAVDREGAPSTQNQARCALLFLYREVLERDPGPLEQVAPAKRSRNVPVVSSAEEAGAVLAAMKGENALVARLLHGAGLRFIEALRLRVKASAARKRPRLRAPTDYRARRQGQQRPPYAKFRCGGIRQREPS